MSDDEARQAEQKAREEAEAVLVSLRIIELHDNPIAGNFDADHLKAVHAYLFQDLPHHRPGVTRDDTAETWIKHRALENSRAAYDVPYVSQGVESKIAATLEQFGGPETIKGLTEDAAAQRIAQLYGDLDHAHGFYEGNSRTLREFTRELADAAGFQLDWVHSGVGTKERNALYVARDLAVLERAYPDLTPEKAMQTNDRAEYEASIVIADLKRAVADKPLPAIIRTGLSAGVERARERDDNQPLTADEVLIRFTDPELKARYEAQQQREQRQRDDSATPEAARSGTPRGASADSREQSKEKTEKDAKLAASRPEVTRDAERPERDHDRGPNRGGGRGGRGR